MLTLLSKSGGLSIKKGEFRGSDIRHKALSGSLMGTDVTRVTRQVSFVVVECLQGGYNVGSQHKYKLGGVRCEQGHNSTSGLPSRLIVAVLLSHGTTGPTDPFSGQGLTLRLRTDKQINTTHNK